MNYQPRKSHDYWIWSFCHNRNIVHKYHSFLPNFDIITSQGSSNFQTLEKWPKIKFWTSRNIHNFKFRTFYCCLVVICCFETAWRNLGTWPRRGAPISHKKFAPIIIVCQRWRHSEKTETSLAFYLDAILTCGFFKSHIFWMCFSSKNKTTCFFGSAVPL